MKICALTMVYRDYWALEQWFRHYSAWLEAENLFVIAHGEDPLIAALCPGAQVWTIPRDDLTGFDRRRGRMLNGFQTGLLELYDWVIRTDVDELLCPDPGQSLHACLAGCDAPAVFALGLNVVELPGDPALTANVFETRRTAVFSGHYSKACAIREPVALMRHGVQVRPRRVNRFQYLMPRGLYLAHLKHANRAALKASNAHRVEIASGAGKGLPGAAWRNADEKAAAFFAEVAQMPNVPWPEAVEAAYEMLASNPLRDAETGLIRSRSLRFNTRTVLPDGFGAAQSS